MSDIFSDEFSYSSKPLKKKQPPSIEYGDEFSYASPTTTRRKVKPQKRVIVQADPSRVTSQDVDQGIGDAALTALTFPGGLVRRGVQAAGDWALKKLGKPGIKTKPLPSITEGPGKFFSAVAETPSTAQALKSAGLTPPKTGNPQVDAHNEKIFNVGTFAADVLQEPTWGLYKGAVRAARSALPSKTGKFISEGPSYQTVLPGSKVPKGYAKEIDDQVKRDFTLEAQPLERSGVGGRAASDMWAKSADPGYKTYSGGATYINPLKSDRAKSAYLHSTNKAIKTADNSLPSAQVSLGQSAKISSDSEKYIREQLKGVMPKKQVDDLVKKMKTDMAWETNSKESIEDFVIRMRKNPQDVSKVGFNVPPLLPPEPGKRFFTEPFMTKENMAKYISRAKRVASRSINDIKNQLITASERILKNSGINASRVYGETIKDFAKTTSQRLSVGKTKKGLDVDEMFSGGLKAKPSMVKDKEKLLKIFYNDKKTYQKKSQALLVYLAGGEKASGSALSLKQLFHNKKLLHELKKKHEDFATKMAKDQGHMNRSDDWSNLLDKLIKDTESGIRRYTQRLDSVSGGKANFTSSYLTANNRFRSLSHAESHFFAKKLDHSGDISTHTKAIGGQSVARGEGFTYPLIRAIGETSRSIASGAHGVTQKIPWDLARRAGTSPESVDVHAPKQKRQRQRQIGR